MKTKMRFLSAYVKSETRAALERAAKQHGLTLSAAIAACIESTLSFNAAAIETGTKKDSGDARSMENV